MWESIPGWHAKGVPKVTPMMTAAGMDSRQTVEIHCLFARGRGWSVSEDVNAFIALACPLHQNPLKTCGFLGIHSGLACQRCPQSDPNDDRSGNGFPPNSGNSLSFRKGTRMECFRTCKRVHRSCMPPSPKPFKNMSFPWNPFRVGMPKVSPK